jgi:hypothetical protein
MSFLAQAISAEKSADRQAHRLSRARGGLWKRSIAPNKDVIVEPGKHLATSRANVQHG